MYAADLYNADSMLAHSHACVKCMKSALILLKRREANPSKELSNPRSITSEKDLNFVMVQTS